MDDLVAERVDREQGWGDGAAGRLVSSLVGFARLLRQNGIEVSSGRLIDASRSLPHIDIGNRDEFYHALRSNMIAGADDIDRFDRLFNAYWHHDVIEQESLEEEQPEAGKTGRDTTDHDNVDMETIHRELREKSAGETDPLKPESYSAVEVLAAKDFAKLTPAEVREVERLIQRIAPKLLTVQSRRYKAAESGALFDFRRSVRESMRAGGDFVDLSWRTRRIQKARLVLLCDVSHSMEAYSRFLIQFMYAFQNEVAGTETFVFSTRLTRLTPALRGKRLDEALRQATAPATGWSSGTTIGTCLREFVTDPGAKLLNRRTVIVILSDGWDRGDVRLLGEQMRVIKRRSRIVIWLNPLLGDTEYRPLVAGMRAALPHVDLFLPCHNLASLRAFAERLTAV